MVSLSPQFKERYPGTGIGVLRAEGVRNPPTCDPLDRVKEALEEDIRNSFPDKATVKAHPAVEIYRNYYKRFKSTYHVLNQVHSIASQGRTIPQVAALVEAMFMAELKNMVLTSGHDLAHLKPPVVMDVAQGGEGFTRLAGQEASVKAGDIILRDEEGVTGSVIYGPDQRTMIRPRTTEVLFVCWGVPDLGEGIMATHLRDIESYLKLIAPECRVVESRVII